MSGHQSFREIAVQNLTNSVGVYALCDLDQVPIYVGQSRDGIRSRVRRHLTSARSDIIANRQIDVWEIAFVWAWPLDSLSEIDCLEASIFAQYDRQSSLMNGRALPLPETPHLVFAPQVVQVIDEEERRVRLQPSQRLPRQIQQYNLLVDYLLNVKDAPHLKRSLQAHFERLLRYHEKFL